ncbi:MAG: hypothetical protein L0211_06480 [Planctomycetaceae bacterium]|nr:hypothetical protein [Planctomycetaceae bacterium]
MASVRCSLHVKSDDLDRAIAKIKQSLKKQGYRPGDKPLEEYLKLDGARFRGLVVSTPVGGWVSILDSQPDRTPEFAVDLSKQLKTHALLARASWDGWWTYELYRSGKVVDAFDCREEARRQQELHRQKHERPPPEILDIAARLSTGDLTEEDQRKLLAYIETNPHCAPDLAARAMGVVLGISDERTAGLCPPDTIESALTPARLELLKPLLAADVTAEAVRAVLDDGSAAGNIVLMRFLPLLGIDAGYFDLSYSWLFLEDSGVPEDITPSGIEFARHLLYEPDGGRDAAGTS